MEWGWARRPGAGVTGQGESGLGLREQAVGAALGGHDGLLQWPQRRHRRG